MNVMIDYHAIGGTSFSLCLLYHVINLCSMELGDLMMQSLNDFLGDLIGAERDAELISGTINNINHCLLDVIVNLVHAEV